MREWQDVEFNGADDMAPHLRMEEGLILVDHRSLLGAMSRTASDTWTPIASPTPGRPYMWFANSEHRLTARVEDEVGFCWAGHVFDSDTAETLATLCVPLDASLLATEH